MRPQNRYVFPIVFGVFLILGISIGYLITGAPQPPSPPPQTSIPTKVASQNQTNILIVGVEQVNQAETRLLSMWLYISQTNAAHIILLPLYPGSRLNTNLVYAIPHQSVFLNSQSTDTAAETPIIASQNTWWDDLILIDKVGLLEVMDLLGGVEQYAVPLGNILGLNDFPLPWEQPIEVLHYQKALLEQVCSSTANFFQAESPDDLIIPSAEHLQSTLSYQELFVEWQRITNPEAELICEIPYSE